LSGYKSLVVKRWLRDHRDSDPLKPPPKKAPLHRTPRRDRVRRFEDLRPPGGPERAA
jgi:hypothetical protein